MFGCKVLIEILLMQSKFLTPIFISPLNLLTPMSDQERISPYNIYTISTR